MPQPFDSILSSKQSKALKSWTGKMQRNNFHLNLTTNWKKRGINSFFLSEISIFINFWVLEMFEKFDFWREKNVNMGETKIFFHCEWRWKENIFRIIMGLALNRRLSGKFMVRRFNYDFLM